MRKCVNCSWAGENAVGPLNHCPICGDDTKDMIPIQSKPETIIEKQVEKPVEQKKTDFDFDNDGDVDDKDRSLAGQLLGKSPKKRGKQ